MSDFNSGFWTVWIWVIVLGGILIGGSSLASFEQVIETWAGVYYVAGTVSLFAHVMSRTTAASALLFTERADRDRCQRAGR